MSNLILMYNVFVHRCSSGLHTHGDIGTLAQLSVVLTGSQVTFQLLPPGAGWSRANTVLSNYAFYREAFSQNWMSVVVAIISSGVSTFFKSLRIWDETWLQLYHVITLSQTESPPSNHYIGGSTCMTSMYRVMLSHESP